MENSAFPVEGRARGSGIPTTTGAVGASFRSPTRCPVYLAPRAGLQPVSVDLLSLLAILCAVLQDPLQLKAAKFLQNYTCHALELRFFIPRKGPRYHGFA